MSGDHCTILLYVINCIYAHDVIMMAAQESVLWWTQLWGPFSRSTQKKIQGYPQSSPEEMWHRPRLMGGPCTGQNCLERPHQARRLWVWTTVHQGSCRQTQQAERKSWESPDHRSALPMSPLRSQIQGSNCSCEPSANTFPDLVINSMMAIYYFLSVNRAHLRTEGELIIIIIIIDITMACDLSFQCLFPN